MLFEVLELTGGTGSYYQTKMKTEHDYNNESFGFRAASLYYQC